MLDKSLKGKPLIPLTVPLIPLTIPLIPLKVPLIRFIIIFLFSHHEINVYFDPEVKSIIPGLFTL